MILLVHLNQTYHSCSYFFFFFSSRRRHTRLQGDWSSDVCSSDLTFEPETTEHYLDLYDYSVVDLAGRHVLVNRTRDGRLQVFDNPVFHGGLGLNLEIRRFSEQGLRRAFTEAGFSGLPFYDQNYLPF